MLIAMSSHEMVCGFAIYQYLFVITKPTNTVRLTHWQSYIFSSYLRQGINAKRAMVPNLSCLLMLFLRQGSIMSLWSLSSLVLIFYVIEYDGIKERLG